ncbi:MAG: hypothetical protein JWL70_2517 [Acidimicrobiia bacterium]|nr:hypothetical protein [Acidimicrobiia bacterium]
MTLAVTVLALVAFGILYGRLRRRRRRAAETGQASYLVPVAAIGVLVVVALATRQWAGLAVLVVIGSVVLYLLYLRSKTGSSDRSA